MPGGHGVHRLRMRPAGACIDATGAVSPPARTIFTTKLAQAMAPSFAWFVFGRAKKKNSQETQTPLGPTAQP